MLFHDIKQEKHLKITTILLLEILFASNSCAFYVNFSGWIHLIISISIWFHGNLEHADLPPLTQSLYCFMFLKTFFIIETCT